MSTPLSETRSLGAMTQWRTAPVTAGWAHPIWSGSARRAPPPLARVSPCAFFLSLCVPRHRLQHTVGARQKAPITFSSVPKCRRCATEARARLLELPTEDVPRSSPLPQTAIASYFHACAAALIQPTGMSRMLSTATCIQARLFRLLALSLVLRPARRAFVNVREASTVATTLSIALTCAAS